MVNRYQFSRWIVWTAIFTFCCPVIASSEVAPDFVRTDIDGNVRSLYDELQTGKAVLIDFFHTRCHSCQDVSADVEKIRTDFQEGLTVWKLSIYNESAESIREFKEVYGSSSVAFSNCGDLFDYYNEALEFKAAVTPSFVLVLPDRTVGYGDIGFHRRELRAALEEHGLRVSTVESINEYAPHIELNQFPLSDEFEITLTTQKPTTLSISLYSSDGRNLGLLYENALDGNRVYAIPLHLGSTNSGLYFLRFTGDHINATRSVVIVK